VRRAIRAVRLLFSHLPAAEFSPLKLKQVRDEMVASGTLSRPVINSRVGIVKRAFRWAVAEELVPAAVFHALLAVSGTSPPDVGATSPGANRSPPRRPRMPST
jgi:hypothetical protein